MTIKTEMKIYPNGSSYLELSVGQTIIGHVTEVNGGLLVQGRA